MSARERTAQDPLITIARRSVNQRNDEGARHVPDPNKIPLDVRITICTDRGARSPSPASTSRPAGSSAMAWKASTMRSRGLRIPQSPPSASRICSFTLLNLAVSGSVIESAEMASEQHCGVVPPRIVELPRLMLVGNKAAAPGRVGVRGPGHLDEDCARIRCPVWPAACGCAVMALAPWATGRP